MAREPQGHLDAMAGDDELNCAETAAAIGCSTRSLERWRRECPDRLKWFLIGQTPHYLVSVVRQYLAVRAAYLTGGPLPQQPPASKSRPTPKLQRKTPEQKPARRAARKLRQGEVALGDVGK